jgi:excisionase family DNA binding protein
MEEFLTVEQVAKRLQVTERTVREWLRTKRLKGVRAGRQWRIRESDLSTFLRELNGTPFGLMDPAELLGKLFHDFKRLQADREQHTILYTAFDFFVTAYSLVDWIINSTPEMTKAERDKLRAPMIVKICGDIANGTKHFIRNRPKQTSITTHSAPPAFSGAFSNASQTAWSAWVELNPAEAKAASIPQICPIEQLAEAVLAHWKAYFEGWG